MRREEHTTTKGFLGVVVGAVLVSFRSAHGRFLGVTCRVGSGLSVAFCFGVPV